MAVIRMLLDGGRWVEAGRFSKLMRPPPHARACLVAARAHRPQQDGLLDLETLA